MSYKEEFEEYNLLEKDVLIGMLISNKEDKIKEDECRMYNPGTDTGLRCMYCGKSQYEHYNYCLKKY